MLAGLGHGLELLPAEVCAQMQEVGLLVRSTVREQPPSFVKFLGLG